MMHILFLIFLLNSGSLHCYVVQINNPQETEKKPEDDHSHATSEFEDEPEDSDVKTDANNDDSDDFNDYIQELELSNDPDTDNIVIKTIAVPVNHYGRNKKFTWQMRFLQNDQFFTNSSPIYVTVGGNAPLSDKFLKEGLMYELAKETNGTMFVTEHRYYGDNVTDENLMYLHSKQALKDLKVLLHHLKRLPGCQDSQVVLIGSDYAGNLAAWMKLIYPNKVDIAIVSSAPVLAIYDFKDYLIQAKISFTNSASFNCVYNIEKVFGYFLKCFKDGNFDEFVRNANVCRDVDMTKTENQHTFFFKEMFLLMSNVEDGVEKMNKSCEHFELRYKDVLENFVPNQRRTLFLPFEKNNTTNNESCNDYDFKNFIDSIQNSEDKRNKHWLYQCCNEFGFFPVTSEQFLGREALPAEFYHKVCAALFGEEYNVNTLHYKVALTNERYHGSEINLRNVIFVHGDLDPWKHLGVTKKHHHSPVVIIKGESHSKDLKASKASDSPDLRDARIYIKSVVKEFLYELTDNEELKKLLNQSLIATKSWNRIEHNTHYETFESQSWDASV